MPTKSEKRKFAPYAAIGILLILWFLWWYPKHYSVGAPVSQGEVLPSPENILQNDEPESSQTATVSKNLPFVFTVTSPKNGSHVASNKIVVTGKTTPRADVFLNEIDTLADSQGNFSISYILEEGENYLVVGANDENGHFDEQELTVTYDVGN